MPAWLIWMLIELVVKFGATWLINRFPGLPAAVKAILQTLADNLAKARQVAEMTPDAYASYVQTCKDTARSQIENYYRNKKKWRR